MKELYAATTTESVLLIIGASILISGIIIGCAMIRDYRNYLNEHIKARFTLADFFRRERFYLFLFLFLVLTIIILQNLWYLIER